MSMRAPLPTLALLFIAACAPRLKPLGAGTPAVALPSAALSFERRLIVFEWQLEDPDLTARGEGAARVAAPDSARMDFFTAGGLGSGAAVLIGQALRLPSRGDDIARRVVPPAPLLWATLGRLSLPPATDTTARANGDTIRADIGAPIAWRVTFVRDTLRRVERVDGGRVVEWVDRGANGHVRYRHESSRRQLDLTITRTADVDVFDAAIWTLP